MSVIVNGQTGAGGVSDVGDLTTTGLTPGNYQVVWSNAPQIDALQRYSPSNQIP